ncbi:efflux RND transporter periplasmic adaptor subunit [Roseinatronobacter alkalisoli]|uniref:Efflux RND transporter periplasmic adaptor subunit n=1 Tax=Roseinatronobacter alkalisoli TaxID=3028235 RepID=A0ABT5T3I4_9RHOB|nr:efflux RND transporter periplasmic adaptor subunit [Roseinatronobacter sp. HJB301]MDD7969594.1 efflux RND transporter periplasmic adaptor subunit [Roseinatronobacter sp. HJB301]
MRLFPLFTALLVMSVIYLMVMERDALLGYAGVVTEDPAPQEATTPPEARVRVVVQNSQAREIENAVVLRGRTEAARQVDVQAETSGLVTSEPLRRGAQVAAGAPLCEVAPGVRKAALDEARARLTEAEINYRAAAGLSESGYAPETRLANARAALQAAQAGVDRAVEEMARLVMYAPFDGILESDTAELGSLLQPGALCATLIQLDTIRLVGFATETQIDRLVPGAMAQARLASGRQVAGTVSFLSRAADPQTRTFRVEVTVPNADLSIRDGQSADIMVMSSPESGHMLPGSALTLNDQGELGLRLVDDDGLVSFAPATVLRDTDTGVWLTGLPDTITAIILGQEFTRERAYVDAVAKDAQEVNP